MSVKFAFAGFRHGHINAMHATCLKRDDLDIVACCEDDPETRDALSAGGSIDITHQTIEEMLDDVDCDVVAVGDYYGRRGELLIKALKAGKHVIGDKPLCARLDELDEIEKLSKKKKLAVGCMLDLRDSGTFLGLREIIQDGVIGEVLAIQFGGQHPLSLGSRPKWYFEEGKHGGTLNDIGVHAIDLIPWMTGLTFTEINAARSWNAIASDYPHFHDAGQMMLTMNNGCGVLGDVSYFTPDSFGYGTPWYWRFTVWGRDGVAETSSVTKVTTVAVNGEKELRSIEPATPETAGYLDDFLADVRGDELPADRRSTASTLSASRTTLRVQALGNENRNQINL